MQIRLGRTEKGFCTLAGIKDFWPMGRDIKAKASSPRNTLLGWDLGVCVGKCLFI